MPECIVCKGYYKVDQSCKEAEQRRQEVEQRCREAEQCRKETEQRYKEAEQRCEGAEQRCEGAGQRRKGAIQRYREAERRCKEAEHCCKRCGSDNSAWEEWRRSEPVEQGGFQGLRYFTDPHGHVPFLIVIVALGLGLMGMAGLWQGINLAARLLATVATVGGCLVIIQGVYEGRHALRETEMLAQVRPRKPGKGIYIRLNAQLKTILMPALIMALIMLLAYALVQSDALWKLADWLLLEREEEVPPPPPPPSPPSDEVSEEEKPAEPPPDEFRERVKRALPVLFMFGYIGFCLSLAYSSSMMLARKYIKRMNEVLPHPIFARPKKLAEIVRKEAEVELGRIAPESTNESWMGYVQVGEQLKCPFPLLPPGAGAPVAAGVPLSQQIEGGESRLIDAGAGQVTAGIPLSQQVGSDGPRLTDTGAVQVAAGVPLSQQVEGWWQAATWVWDELARTDDGGIEMKVARQEIYQLPKPTDKPEHHPHPRVRYTVRADRWGRIVEIKRDEDQAEQPSNYR